MGKVVAMADWFYGRDGQQQGPVSSAGLKQLADSGQLRPDDLVWQEGMAKWVAASQVKGLFAPPAAPAADAPLPIAPPYSPPAVPLMQGGAISPSYMQPERRSGMALASLICGILFCVPFCSLLAIIFGILGIQQTGEGKRPGRGMALTGLILGSVGMFLIVIAIPMSILLPSLSRAREIANRVKCAANERSIGMAILLYCNDNRGAYPPDLATLAKAEDVDLKTFVCPSSNDTPATSTDTLLSGGHCSYVYLGKGLNARTVDPSAVVLYENAADHEQQGANYLFGDGHVEFDSQSPIGTSGQPGLKG